MKSVTLGFLMVTVVVAAAVALPLTLHYRAEAKYLENEAKLQAQAGRLSELSADNERLSNAVARLDKAALTPEQSRELLRLRGQIGPLRQAARELEQLK